MALEDHFLTALVEVSQFNMKKILFALGLLFAPLAALAQTTNIWNLPTTRATPNSDDYFPLGGATGGTAKILVSSFPTLSSTSTLTNKTLDTATNTFKINGAQVTSIGSNLSISGGVLNAVVTVLGVTVSTTTDNSLFVTNSNIGGSMLVGLNYSGNTNAIGAPTSTVYFGTGLNIPVDIISNGTVVESVTGTGVAVTGTLSSSGAFTASGTATLAGGALFNTNVGVAIGGIGYNSTWGLNIQGKTGGAYDFALFSVSGFNLMLNPTGTTAISFPGAGGVTFSGAGGVYVSGGINDASVFYFSNAGTSQLYNNSTAYGVKLAGGTAGASLTLFGSTNAQASQSYLQANAQYFQSASGTNYALLSSGSYLLYGAYSSDTTAHIVASKSNFGLTVVDVKDYGAVGNGKRVTGTTSITASANVLTVTGASFVSGDIGKVILVPGAGTLGSYSNPSYQTLATTITGVNSSTQVTLAANASNTLSSVSTTVTYGTDDTTKITAAMAALTNFSSLYFPAGIYMTSGMYFNAGLSYVSIYGEGMGISTLCATSPSVVINITSSEKGFYNVHDITLDGSCNTRTSGQQAFICDATSSKAWHVEVLNSGEFAIFFGGFNPAGLTDCQVSNCYVRHCYADGINFAFVGNSSMVDNHVDGSDDDCLALGYGVFNAGTLVVGATYTIYSVGSTSWTSIGAASNTQGISFVATGAGSGSGIAAGIANNILVTGNYAKARTDLPTTWGRGLLVLRAYNVTASDNHFDTIKQMAMYVTTDDSTNTCRPYHVNLLHNTARNVSINSGGGVILECLDNSTFKGNVIQDVQTSDCVLWSDYNNLEISDNTVNQQINVSNGRAFHTQENTSGTNGVTLKTTWTNLNLSHNHVFMSGASTIQSYYITNSHVSMPKTVVDGNEDSQYYSGNYIYTDYLGANSKVVNNTSIEGNSVGNGGHGSAPTTANNN